MAQGGTPGTVSRPPAEDDPRFALSYLLAPEFSQYIAIMAILEASVTDLTPREVAAQLEAAGTRLDDETVQVRLDQLREWKAVAVRTDSAGILRFQDLMARNWRYTASPVGRHVQRFYQKVLAGTRLAREIPLTSLARVVEACEALAARPEPGPDTAEQVGRLFVSHDDLDTALVGAEDSLAGMMDRFDLDDAATAQLKTLIVGYATRVADELERGSARAHRALAKLRERFGGLAAHAVEASDAQVLIEQGALAASRGGRPEDWSGLLSWFDPDFGRSIRFAMRLVRALPGMHVNLRRHHSSAGTASSRARALALARAAADPVLGTAVWRAALGDHPWRKLHGETDEPEGDRVRSWREGAGVEVPAMLRTTGRSGARGRAPAARDGAEARAALEIVRRQRLQDHAEAIHEILASGDRGTLSLPAARLALASLMAAAGAETTGGRRTGIRDGLACTLIDRPAAEGRLEAPGWTIRVPGRHLVFHLPSTARVAG